LQHAFPELETIQENAMVAAMSTNGDHRPTLKTLAAITGLGVSTVSQALRDSPEISDETRARVKLAAQQAGYRPNRAGVRLRTGKSNVISLILNPQDGGSGFFANIVYGISDALAGTPYHLVITPYSLDDPMAPVRYVVETNSADGVIISRTVADDPRVRFLANSNIPFVTHGRTDMGLNHAYVDYDNEAFAVEAVRNLATRGRTNIVLFTPPPVLNYYRHTQMGFERGLREFGVSGFHVSEVNSDSSTDELRAAALAITQRVHKPDGIICTSTGQAYAVAAGLADGGMIFGKDFDLVAKPVTDFSRIAMPKLIGINEDFRAAGFELARMVMAIIDGADASTMTYLAAP
jgi:LacI family transcriptional regulator